MDHPPAPRNSKLRATSKGIAAIGATVALIAGMTAPAAAQDAGISQLPDLQEILDGGGDTLPTVPGAPSLPDRPGLGESGGGERALADGIRAAADPFVPEGGFREQVSSAPSDGAEESTRPECAPNVFIGVPGTFEINRDDDPNKPVGLLGGFIGPLRDALGGQLSATFINYDADAGVNGTAYQRSVSSGVKKTLATVTDVAERCEGSQIFLAGFSQGAEIAGDVATEIGQQRTAVDPEQVGGVVLFSDPKRDENSNLIVGTSRSQPLLPQIINGAIDDALRDPSVAQLRSGVDSLNDLSRSLGGGDLLPGIPSSLEEAPSQQSQTDRNDTSGGAGASGTDGGLPPVESDAGGDGGLPPVGGDGGLPQVGGDGADTGTGGGDSGLPSFGDGDEGGLPQIGGATFTSDDLTFSNGLYTADDAADFQYAQNTDADSGANDDNDSPQSPAGDAVLDAIEVDADGEDATVLLDKFRNGECGPLSITACLTADDDDEHEPIDNPYVSNLTTTVDGDDIRLPELVEMCLGRGSAADCAASHPPTDVEQATMDNRGDDATALISFPRDATEGCTTSSRKDDCSGGVTRVEPQNVTAIPDDADFHSYWETEDTTATFTALRAQWAGLGAQVSAARQAFDPDTEELTVPEGIADLLNPGTGESVPLALSDDAGEHGTAVAVEDDGDAIGVATARDFLTQGWELGRTDSDERSRPRAVEALYAVGGCEELTLQDCITAYALESGERHAATRTGAIIAQATQIEAPSADDVAAVDSNEASTENEEDDEAVIEEVAAQQLDATRDALPRTFTEECLTKTYEECSSAAPSRDVPSLPAVADTSDDDTDTGQSQPADNTSQQATSDNSGTSEVGGLDDAGQDAGTTSEESSDASGATRTATDTEDDTSATDSGDAGATDDTSEVQAPTSTSEAGADPTETSSSQTGQEADSTESVGTDQNTTTAEDRGDTTATADEEPGARPSASGAETVDVEEVTIQAVSGGGMAGPRESDFGELTGRVASPCVPGDIVCSLPEDSELARSLVDLGRNIAVDVNELDSAEGATRMGGMLAVQAVDTVLQVTGLPELKVSPESIIAIINLVAGVGLIHMGDVPGGTMLISTTITQLPTAIPEVIEQLQDIPAIIEGLPQAGERAAENLGLVTDRVGGAFDDAGLGDPTNLENLPAMLPGLVQALVADNTGLIEIATNPMYYTSGEKHQAFDTLMVAGDTDAISWNQRWLTKLGEELLGSR